MKHREEDEKHHEEDAGADAAEEQRDDRLFGDEAVNDHRDRGRDEDAQSAAGGKEAIDEAPVVTAADHLGDGDGADGGGGGHGRAGDGGEKRTAEDGGDGQPAGPVPDPGLHRGEEIAPDPAFQQDVRHQQEQRHREQDEPIECRQDRLRRHQGREPAQDQHAEAQPPQREGHGDADEQEREENRNDEKDRHVRRPLAGRQARLPPGQICGAGCAPVKPDAVIRGCSPKW